MANKLRILVQRILGLVVSYFSIVPSIWVILNPFLYIMFLPLGMHFVMTLPWTLLIKLPNPYGRGTLYFLTYVYRPLLDQRSVWGIIEITLMLFGVCLFLWSSIVWMRNVGKLTADGPYRVIRHPQYFGLILAVLGLSLRTARPIALMSWGIMAYTYVLMALFEERSLVNKFGNEYCNYSAKTWFMFPVPKAVTKRFSHATVVAIATLALIVYIMTTVYVSYYLVFSLRGTTF